MSRDPERTHNNDEEQQFVSIYSPKKSFCFLKKIMFHNRCPKVKTQIGHGWTVSSVLILNNALQLNSLRNTYLCVVCVTCYLSSCPELRYVRATYLYFIPALTINEELPVFLQVNMWNLMFSHRLNCQHDGKRFKWSPPSRLTTGIHKLCSFSIFYDEELWTFS